MVRAMNELKNAVETGLVDLPRKDAENAKHGFEICPLLLCALCALKRLNRFGIRIELPARPSQTPCTLHP